MNMTGDPNHETRPNIFGYDCEYPPSTLAWVNSIHTYYQPGPSTSTSIPEAFNPFPNRFNAPESIENDERTDPSKATNQYTSIANDTSVFGATSTSPFDNACSNSTSDVHSPPRNYLNKVHYSRTCKRKLREQFISNRPSKQHITEDRVAEHLARLHISSETVTTDEPEPEQSKAMRLYMCDEMRKLQSETILPQTLLNGIPRPCTALVLWTPPRSLIEQNDYGLNNNNNNNDNNNEECVADANGMDLDLR